MSPTVWRHATISCLLAFLALLIAIPSVSATPLRSRATPAGIPSCTHLSTTAMANVLGSPPLRFKGKTPRSNLCTWEAVRPGHYHEALSVDIVPGKRSIYDVAESDGKKSANKRRKTLRHACCRAQSLEGGVLRQRIGFQQRLGSMHTGTRTADIRAPECSSDPDWTTVNVDSYDSSLMVSVGAVAQLGDVHLSHVIELNKEILTGKIH